jgi:hypothetical protein
MKAKVSIWLNENIIKSEGAICINGGCNKRHQRNKASGRNNGGINVKKKWRNEISFNGGRKLKAWLTSAARIFSVAPALAKATLAARNGG